MISSIDLVAPEVINYDPITCAADMWYVMVCVVVLLGCQCGEAILNILNMTPSFRSLGVVTYVL